MKFLKILFVLLAVSITANAQISTKEVYDLLHKYEIRNKDVVMRIAIHETNWFKSRRAIEDKNIFGFMTGKNVFESYDEAVIAYKKRVGNRRKSGEDYYVFLKRIGYAEDPNYIKKLKRINYEQKL